jgi:1,4-dihydroxy-2-naphthoate octaprenyltransferase
VSALWRAALLVLISIAPGAAYVSVINDLTDRDEDLAAGKANRLAGRSRATAALFLAIPIAVGVVICYLWRDDALLLSLYLAAWLAFSLYSIPPFRFKTRGILGVLCDASGSNLFPSLVAVILAYRAAYRPVSFLWLAAVGAWTMANGIRGILWHQLTDVDNDRAAGVRTFVERHPPHVAIRLGTYIAFPLELLALAVILWQIRSPLPLLFLGIYAFVASKRLRHWSMNAVIVAPKPRYLIVLHEYYGLYLPLAILIASALRHPLDWLALAIHICIFPAFLVRTARDYGNLIREHRYPWQ